MPPSSKAGKRNPCQRQVSVIKKLLIKYEIYYFLKEEKGIRIFVTTSLVETQGVRVLKKTKISLLTTGPGHGQIPAIVVDMESFARRNDLSVFHTDLLGHIFFQQLETGEIRRESGPQVPGAEVGKKMEFSITNSGIDAP
jgi:hypothetical protein